MCRSDGWIGLSSTRTSASPRAKGGVGISASFNTPLGSPVSRKINAFINTSQVFRRRLIPKPVPAARVRCFVGCQSSTATGFQRVKFGFDFSIEIRQVLVQDDPAV